LKKEVGENKHMPKAAIYDPYLDTLGGGERYCLTVAEILLSLGWTVDLFWSGSQDIIKLATDRFGLNLTNLNIIPDIFGLKNIDIDNLEDQNPQNFISHKSIKTSLISKYKQTKVYDFIFFLNDGSIPFLFSKKNILHVQVPFISQQNFKERAINQLKFKMINKIVCNSKFTASYLPKFLNHKIDIIYPPVDVESMVHNIPKQNIILSVGRFDNVLNSKKQELLVDTFSKLVLQNPGTDWKLVLMGGSKQSPENNHFLLHLKNISQNLPVEFIVNPDYEQLKQIYSISKIYWHAAGYGVNVLNHPEQCEHFGMAPVEAMASGLVPILVNQGGLPEIINDGVDGFLWDEPSKMLAKTQLLIATPTELTKMSQESIKSSAKFGKNIFKEKITNLLH